MPGHSSTDHEKKCITQPLLRALSAQEFERGLKAAAALKVLGPLQAAGINEKNKSIAAVARLVRAKVARMSDLNVHRLATMVAHGTLTELAAVVEAEHDGPLPEDPNAFATVVEEVLTSRALSSLLAQWPPGLVKLAINEMWEHEDIELEIRDRLLDEVTRAAKKPRTSKSSSKAPAEPTDQRLVRLLDESIEADECREATARRAVRRASVNAAEAPEQLSGRSAPPALDVDHSLDVLIATAVSNAELQLGSSSAVLREMLEWLISLDPGRPRSWYPYGILMSGTPAEAGFRPPTAACLTQCILGQMAGHALRGQLKELGALAREHPADVELGIEDETAVPFLGPLLTALIDSPDLLGRLLNAVGRPFVDWRQFVASVRNVAPDDNRDPDRLIRAETVFNAVESTLRRWSSLPEGFGQGLEPTAEELLVLRASCRRKRRDFVGCLELLSRLDEETVETKSLKTATLERALATAGVDDLAAMRVPTTPGERRAVRERFERAQSLLGLVEEGDSGNVYVALLLGLLHLARGEDEEAAHRLARASRGISVGLAAPELEREVRFHAALARLRLLEPGTDAACFEDIRSALDDGYIPPDDVVVAVAEALQAHGSPEVMALLSRLPDAVARASGLRGVVAELGQSGNPDALSEIIRLTSGDAAKAIPLVERFEMIRAGIEGADRVGEVETAERLALLLDDVVQREQNSDHELRWASLLGTNEVIRSTLGPASADAYRLHIFRRLGHLDEARAIAEGLFYRAASGDLQEFDAAELLTLLTELGVADERLVELRRVLPPPVSSPDTDESREPVTVLFVGGNETQEAYRQPVESALASLYGDSVQVEWFHSGWTSNWSSIADRIEARYVSADALVLMAYVRTMFGKRIRRSAGEKGIPWIACTGHGRDSVERAIRRAVEVAQDRKSSRI
jgi:hypothetical protein